jgi:hypothetical protein
MVHQTLNDMKRILFILVLTGALAGCTKNDTLYDVGLHATMLALDSSSASFKVALTYDGTDPIESKGLVYGRYRVPSLTQDYALGEYFIQVYEGDANPFQVEVIDLTRFKTDPITGQVLSDGRYFYRPFAVIRGNAYYGAVDSLRVD